MPDEREQLRNLVKDISDRLAEKHVNDAVEHLLGVVSATASGFTTGGGILTTNGEYSYFISVAKKGNQEANKEEVKAAMDRHYDYVTSKETVSDDKKPSDKQRFKIHIE